MPQTLELTDSELDDILGPSKAKGPSVSAKSADLSDSELDDILGPVKSETKPAVITSALPQSKPLTSGAVRVGSVPILAEDPSLAPVKGPAFVTPVTVPRGSMPSRKSQEPGIGTYGENIANHLRSGNYGEAAKQLFQSPVDMKAVDDELSNFMVGPFALYKGAIEGAVQAGTSPGNLAIAGGIAGATKLASKVASPYVKAAWELADTALSAYFAGSMATGAAKSGKAAWDAIQSGNYEDAAKELGLGSVDALFAYAGAKNAVAKGLDIKTGIEQGVKLGKLRSAMQDELNRNESARRAAEQESLKPKQITGEVPEEPAAQPAPVQQLPPPPGTSVGKVIETPEGKHTVTEISDAGKPQSTVTYDTELPDGTVIKGRRLPLARFEKITAPPSVKQQVKDAKEVRLGQVPEVPAVKPVAPAPESREVIQSNVPAAEVLGQAGAAEPVPEVQQNPKLSETLQPPVAAPTPQPTASLPTIAPQAAAEHPFANPLPVPTPDSQVINAKDYANDYGQTELGHGVDEELQKRYPDVNFRRVVFKGDGWFVLPDSEDKSEGGPFPSQGQAIQSLIAEKSGTPTGKVVEVPGTELSDDEIEALLSSVPAEAGAGPARGETPESALPAGKEVDTEGTETKREPKTSGIQEEVPSKPQGESQPEVTTSLTKSGRKGYILLEAEGAPTIKKPVSDAEQASRALEQYRDQHGLGSSDFTENTGNLVEEGTGNIIGRVSYNGRVWDENNNPVWPTTEKGVGKAPSEYKPKSQEQKEETRSESLIPKRGESHPNALPGGKSPVSGPDNHRVKSDIVDMAVAPGIEELKVFDPIISAIPIDVVNMLGGKERATKMLLHDQSVLADALTSPFSIDIFPNPSSLLKVVTRLRAKLSSTGDRLARSKYLPALKAFNGQLRKSLSGGTSIRDTPAGQTATLSGAKNSLLPSGMRRGPFEPLSAEATNEIGHTESVAQSPTSNKAIPLAGPGGRTGIHPAISKIQVTENTSAQPSKQASEPGGPKVAPGDELKESLAQSGFDKSYAELTPGQRESVDLRAERRRTPIKPAEKKPVTPQVPARTAPEKGVESSGGGSEAKSGASRGTEGVSEPRRPSTPGRYGHEVKVLIPGENRGFQSKYAVRELADVIPSHNPFTLQSNPDYPFRNDRNYTDQRNSERIISQTAQFDPAYVVSDSPTASDGAPITDKDGNVLGGNSRAMTIARVYKQRPELAKAYKELLKQKASQFGVSPEDVDAMDQPVLVRQLDSELSREETQAAITDLNKSGTAALSSSERAIADSNRVSPETLDQLAGMIEAQGPSGTLSAALDGKGGTYIVDRLVKDGVITTQEKPTLFDNRGTLTPVAKERISKLMLGRLFEDSSQFESVPPAMRNKLERIVAPLSRVAGKEGWDLLPDVRDAIQMIEHARATGIKNLDDLVSQQGLFGGSDQEYSPKVVALAKTISENGPVNLAKAFNRYANDSKGPTMFGEVSPDEAFKDAFEEGVEILGSRRQVPGFYSQLERTVASKFPEKVGPQQALAIIRNPQNGVKADEIKWTGIEDWLNQQKRQLTKAEVQEFLSDNETHVEEVEHYDPTRGVDNPSPTKFQQYTLPGGTNYREVLMVLPPKPVNIEWDQDGDTWRSKALPELPGSAGRFEVYNFSKRERGTKKPYELYDATLRSSIEVNSLEDAKKKAVLLATREKTDRDNSAYKSPHWDEKNVLAHVRLTDRTIPDGKKMLFVEEIQSDWHQSGKRKGYHGPEITEDDIDLKFIPPEVPEGHDPKVYPGYWESFDKRDGRMITRHAGRDTRDDAMREALVFGREKRREGVPNAPFSKSWPEFAFRRTIRYAAEHGYDSVGWTTGEQQAERYDLSKQIDSLKVLEGNFDEAGGDGYEVTARKGGQKVIEKRVSAKDLPDLIGKEMADKAITQIEENKKREVPKYTAEFHGIDLKVGGEGMKGFYDQIIPSYANKYAKKWGARVGSAEVPQKQFQEYKYNGPEFGLSEVETVYGLSRGYGNIQISPITGKKLTFPFTRVTVTNQLADVTRLMRTGKSFSDAMAESALNHGTNLDDLFGGETEEVHKESTLKVHSMDITPSMKKSVMDEGQPLFYSPTDTPPLPFRSPKIPKLSEETRTEPFSTGAPTRYHAKLAEVEVIPLEDRYSRIASAYVTTPSGMEFIGRSAGLPSDKVGSSHVGLHISSKDADRVARSMQHILDKEFPGKAPTDAARIQKAFREASDEGKSIIFISDHQKWDGHVETALAEELAHAIQASLTGATKTHFGNARQSFSDSHLYQKAQEALARRYPDVKPGSNTEALEIGARLMWPDGYIELGLTPDEGRTLAAQYVRTLRKEHGTQPSRQVAQQVFESFQSKRRTGSSSGSLRQERGDRAPESSGPNVSAESIAEPDDNGDARHDSQEPTSDEALPGVEQKPSKIGKSIETKAIEQGLTEGFEGTAGYDPITVKDQAKRASALMSDYDRALRVINGEEPLPDGLRGTALIIAVEDYIERNGDGRLAFALANSPLVSETSAAAQELRLAAERKPDSVASKLREIKMARENAAAKRYGTIKKAKKVITDDIKQSIRKAAPKAKDWNSFIADLVCK